MGASLVHTYILFPGRRQRTVPPVLVDRCIERPRQRCRHPWLPRWSRGGVYTEVVVSLVFDHETSVLVLKVASTALSSRHTSIRHH